MDWVHCNNCYVQPGDVDMKKFFITNCGHIYCNECLQTNQSKECRICLIKYTSIPLSSNMNSEVEIYFRDPVINLKKQIKILEFQQSHRIRLVSYNKERLRNYKALKKENYNLNEELSLFKQENFNLKEEIKTLKENLFEYKKKHEFLSGRDQSRRLQNTPQMHSFSQFLTKEINRTTPKPLINNMFGNNEVLKEEKYTSASKKILSSNYFIMSGTKSAGRENRTLTTPDIPNFPGSYRSNKMLTPETNTPPTPDSILKDLSQRDPLQRKIKLPGPKSGPSPATKIGLHGLSLSRPTSTPNKETFISNKYLKYFK